MYNCYDYTRPIWKGSKILNESFMPIVDRKVALLHRIDRILCVTDAMQTRLFREGTDYVLDDGCLYIPEGSEINVMTAEEYHPMENIAELTSGAGFAHIDGGFIRFAEGSVFHRMQYSVSYTYSDKWDGPKAPFDESKLPRTRRLLREGKPLTIAYLGDSICVGANASGRMDTPPYAPIWPEMVCERLSEVYGSKIEYINKSKGGTASKWGNDNTVEFFGDTRPDLFVIAFGMNDASGGVDRYAFRDNCRAIADKIKKISPECEFVFVSTTMPNPEAKHFAQNRDHAEHEALLAALADTYGVSAALAPVTSFHKYLLTKKSFADMTGNNVNHPNDFLIRVYAQVLLSTIIGEF